jgi:phosphoglycolate phosphatase
MKAVIFDLDGTLLDTIDDIADSMNEVLGRYGLPLHSVDEYKIFVGDGVTNLVNRSAAAAPAAGHSLSQIETEYRAEYIKRQADKTKPYDGMPETLSALAQRGIKMAVFSNKPYNATLEVVAHYFPGIYFDAIIGQRPGYPIKPNPSGAMEILEIFGLPREEVLYVGDTGTDMQTAKAAGLKAVGALWGFRERDELVQNGADILAERPQGILKYCTR